MRAGVLTDKGKGRPLPASPLELTEELCAQVQAALDEGNVQELDPRVVSAYIEHRTKEQGVLAWLKRCEEFNASYEEEVDEEQAAEDAQHVAQRLEIHKEMHGYRREFAPIPVEAVTLPAGLAAPERNAALEAPRQRRRGVLKVVGHRFVGLLDARTRKALTPRQHELLDADMLQLQYMGEA